MKITFRRILNLLLYLSFCVMVGTGLLMAYRLKAAINGVPASASLMVGGSKAALKVLPAGPSTQARTSGHPALLPQSLPLHRHDASRNRA